jgi:uroporphyrinogen decarboxylase
VAAPDNASCVKGILISMHRRDFLFSTAASAVYPVFGAARLSRKSRVDRALKGEDLDRPPFTLWHHFGLKSAEAHAERTLAFHKDYRTDFVKVMSDFPYPKPAGKWYELKPLSNPFPDQIRALELIRDGLNGDAYFVETIFNPMNVAEKLSSKEDLLRLKNENPTALLAALDVITESEINHAKRAISTGARGILLAVANANSKELSVADYARFSAPFDKRILDAVSGAPFNVLHLHVEREYLDQFSTFAAPVVNYSLHVTGIPIAEARAAFPRQVIAGGIDEVSYKKLTGEEMRAQSQAASLAAGKKFILTPGCSVPNDSSPEELARLPKILGA